MKYELLVATIKGKKAGAETYLSCADPACVKTIADAKEMLNQMDSLLETIKKLDEKYEN